MRKKLMLSIVIALTLALVSPALANHDIINFTKRAGIGIRIGQSFLAQDVTDISEGESGIVIGGRFFYGVNKYVTVGLGVEWEKHAIQNIMVGYEVGDVSTLTILPFIQLRGPGFGLFSPYIFVGTGFNLNKFDVAPSFQTSCLYYYWSYCDIEVENTLAFQIGAGFDYFIAEDIAINVEVIRKFNSSDFTLSSWLYQSAGELNVGTIMFNVGITKLF